MVPFNATMELEDRNPASSMIIDPGIGDSRIDRGPLNDPKSNLALASLKRHSVRMLERQGFGPINHADRTVNLRSTDAGGSDAATLSDRNISGGKARQVYSHEDPWPFPAPGFAATMDSGTYNVSMNSSEEKGTRWSSPGGKKNKPWWLCRSW